MTLLLDPQYLVPPLPADAGPLDRLRRSVPRFAEGPEHARRRAEAVRLLDLVPPESLRAAARELAAADPAEPLVPRVPLTVLAGALGAADPAAVAALVPAVAAAYFPPRPAPAGAEPDRSGPGGVVGRAEAAVVELLDGHGLDPVRVGLLVQACEPVAALVRTALADRAGPVPDGGGDPGDPTAVLAAALLAAPPVPATVRWRPDTGETVTVPLAGIPFGAGPRRCPAQPHALALAAGVLDAVTR